MAIEHQIRTKKLRLFLLDGQTPRPARRVRVEALAEFESENQPGESPAPTMSLGLLQSDHVGYVSFDISQLFESKARAVKLFLRLPARPSDRIEISSDLMKAVEKSTAISINEAAAVAEETAGLPFAQNPDASDWIASPKSFGSQSVAVVGQGDCETMLLSNATVQRHAFVQVVRKLADDEMLKAAAPSPCDTDSQQLPTPPICIRRGALLEFETTWRPMGHGLGEILYSLPLAPCESIKLAIIDWVRQDEATRAEDLSVAEQLLHNQRRERAIEEVVRGVVDEWQRGGTVMGAVGGSYSSSNLSIAASLGAAYSTSAGTRNAAADTLQRLADGIAQATAAIRRLQSTVIVQATQRESERLQTRTVTNHNHCHALTILYYEIVRHYLVETLALRERARDAILLRHPEQTFTADRALKYESQLRQILTNTGVVSGFDAIRRRRNQTEANAAEYGSVSRLIIKVTTGDESTFLDDAREFVRYLLLLNDGSIKEFRVSDDNRVTRENWLYRVGRTNTLIFPDLSGITLDSILQVGVSYHRPGEREINWLMAGLEVLAVTRVTRGSSATSEMVPILRRADINYRFTDGGEWWTDAELPAEVRAVRSSSSLDDQRLEQALLDHLNQNRHAYNRVLWATEDAGARAAMLERYSFEHDGQTGRLIDFVENRVVDVIGDYIVLPMGTRALVDEVVPVWPEPIQQITSIPTRGAFAETKLSNCNACEEIDDSRFWDWQQSPCPGEAPEITGISPGSRARESGAEPSGVPASSIGVEAPQSAPDPTGLANLLDLLGRSDIFRDMSGRAELADVMKSVVNGAVQLTQEQIRQRGETERARIQAERDEDDEDDAGGGGTSGSSGGTSRTGSPASGGSTSSPTPARERERVYRQAENAIDRAERRGDMSPAEARDARRDLTESQLNETILDPIAISATQPSTQREATLSSRRRGALGTRTNPWVIDNFTLDHFDMPEVTTSGQRVQPLLDRIAQELRRHPDDVVHIDGFTDRSGTESHNRTLSQDRANEAGSQLSDRGIPGGARMQPMGRGETHSRGVEEHDAHDRRVEIWHGPAGGDVTSSLTCNVLYDVPLVPQPNKLSCWAAGVSMLVAYRRHVSMSPEEVYRRTGDNINSTTAIPWDTQISYLETIFGMRPVPESTTTGGIITPGRWCDWLNRYGPLYVSVSGSPHVLVVRGMVADSSGATVYINDPWDRNTRFDTDPLIFNPPNRGWRGRVPFSAFIHDFYGVDLGVESSRARVMYIQ